MSAIDHRRIHSKSLASFSMVAEQLSRLLTPKLTALVCDFRDPKALARYTANEQTPRPELEQRIRFVYQVAATLMAGGLPLEGVQAWFTGLNPDLDDHSPAELLRSGDEQTWRDVLAAARKHAEVYDLPSIDETESARPEPATSKA